MLMNINLYKNNNNSSPLTIAKIFFTIEKRYCDESLMFSLFFLYFLDISEVYGRAGCACYFFYRKLSGLWNEKPYYKFFFTKHSYYLQGNNSRKGFGRCRLSCLLHYINYLPIPSAHKQLIRHLPNPFREIPCRTTTVSTLFCPR